MTRLPTRKGIVEEFVDEVCLLARNARYSSYRTYHKFIDFCLWKQVPTRDQFYFVNRLKRLGVAIKPETEDEVELFVGLTVLPKYR